MSELHFEPTRTAGLEALSAFLPHAGADYAKLRNYDLPEQSHPHVSCLSPYVRHRMVTEEEVLRSVLGRHSLRAAEKFVQEVYWRTYWKGWLQMRPGVWSGYRAALSRCRDRLATEAGLRQAWEDACLGRTGLAPFDAWAQELSQTGYLHNHARMWFASIWVFTLRLPWELGADFFMRHLLDGDPASNTLSWRWVAGLQTKGKTYLARPSNIAKYTRGRFADMGDLARDAIALAGPAHPSRSALPTSDDWVPAPGTGVLLTEDDMSPGWLLEGGDTAVGAAALHGTKARSPLAVSERVLNFTEAALKDALSRNASRLGPAGPVTTDPQIIVAWARAQNLSRVLTSFSPVGPAAQQIRALRPLLEEAGIDLVTRIRPFDAEAWPHATHGFFRFKEHIPRLVGQLRGLRAA